MNMTPAGMKRSASAAQLLLAAGAALVVAIVGVGAYPVLASFGTAEVVLTAVRTGTSACLAAVVVLPIAAIVRRLIHEQE